MKSENITVTIGTSQMGIIFRKMTFAPEVHDCDVMFRHPEETSTASRSEKDRTGKTSNSKYSVSGEKQLSRNPHIRRKRKYIELYGIVA